MYGIGASLREERLRQKLVLDNIARSTRISSRYLQAIEAEDYERLPGLIFTRNFVRQYALELQMDPEPLVAKLPKLDESMVQLPVAPTRKRTRNWHNRSNPILGSMLWLMLIGGAGTAAYYHFNGLPKLNLDWLPSAQAAATQQSKAIQPIQSVEDVPSAPSINNAEPEAGLIPGTAVAVTAPEVLPAPRATSLSIAPAGDAAPPLNRAVEVVVTARDAAWVQVTADGKPAYTGTLHPNETKAISADGQVRVLTGNAGALSISLNGKLLESLGPIGQVRSVRLTADGPEFPAPKSAPPADPL